MELATRKKRKFRNEYKGKNKFKIFKKWLLFGPMWRLVMALFTHIFPITTVI
jgi:hypothetical protein